MNVYKLVFTISILLTGLNSIYAKKVTLKSPVENKVRSIEKNTPVYLYDGKKQGKVHYYFYQGGKTINYRIDGKKLFIEGVLRGVNVSDCNDLNLISSTVNNIYFSTIKSLKCLPKLSLHSRQKTYLHIYANDQDEHIVSTRLSQKDIKKIASLPLKGLSLERIKVKQLRPLTRLKQLIYLNLNIYKKNIAFIRKLKNLRALELQFITNKDLKYISRFKKLQYLHLGSIMTADWPTNKITDKGLYYLRNLKNLEFLSLQYTKVRGCGVRYLKKLKKLRFLDLSSCGIQNRKAIKKWARKFKSLKVKFDLD